MCVRFPRILLRERYQPRCQHFGCQQGKKGLEFSQFREQNFVYSSCFSSSPTSLSPVLYACCHLVHCLEGTEQYVSFVSGRRYLECSLFSYTEFEPWTSCFMTCPHTHFWRFLVPLFHEFLLVLLAPGSLFCASTSQLRFYLSLISKVSYLPRVCWLSDFTPEILSSFSWEFFSRSF